MFPLGLEGLNNLTSVGEDLLIEFNDSLKSLGLESLCSLGVHGYFNRSFMIQHNPELRTNLAEDLKVQVEECPGGGIPGTVEIYKNKDRSMFIS